MPALAFEQEEGDVEGLQLGLHQPQRAHHEPKLPRPGTKELGDLQQGRQRAGRRVLQHWWCLLPRSRAGKC